MKKYLLLLIIFLIACGQTTAPTPEPEAIVQAEPATEVPPTETPLPPTNTPSPEPTLPPTETPTITATAPPTETPEPTATAQGRS